MKKIALFAFLCILFIAGCMKEESTKEASSKNNDSQAVEETQSKSDQKDKSSSQENNNSSEDTSNENTESTSEDEITVSKEKMSEEESAYLSSDEHYIEDVVKKNLPEDVVKKRLKAVKGKPQFSINDEGVVEILGIALGDSQEEVEEKWGIADGTKEIIVNQQTKQLIYYYFPFPKNKDKLYYYLVNIFYAANEEFDSAVYEISLSVVYNKKAYPVYRISDEFWKNFSGKSYYGLASPSMIFITEDEQQIIKVNNRGLNKYEIKAEYLGFDNYELVKRDLASLYDEFTSREEVEKYFNDTFEKNRKDDKKK
ncbi:hypothetical protein P9204_01785 [Geobacillus stearothermophilus]|nr:hypothetical protein GS458_0875 [Geobacillus stearothermophilus]MED4299240.1 hypothetical protein [Geobacillus stearothermophilus]